MPMSRLWVWTCDFCGKTTSRASSQIPLPWVQRFEMRPMGDGLFSGYVPQDMADTAVFCCFEHELKWLEAGGHGPVIDPIGVGSNQEPEPLPPSPPGQPAEMLKDNAKRMVMISVGVLKELWDIGDAITVGFYGVFRRQDHIGDVTLTSEEETEGYQVTEKQMYSLRCALHDVQAYLGGDFDV